MLLPANKKQTIEWRLKIMKRMIDGVVNCLAESGGYQLIDEGNIALSIKFCFPEGYWPISLKSKPLSIMPGHINHGDESDIAIWCFDAVDGPKWTTVSFNSDSINMGTGRSNITFIFTFPNSEHRAAFLKELFGKDIKPQEGINITPFAVPVSMVLVPFDGSMEY